jgi:glucose/arabinose dehydrogenase
MSAIRHRVNRRFLRGLPAAVALVLAVATHSIAAQGISLEIVASGIPNLVDIQHAGTNGRLFLVNQQGRILILDGTQVRGTPFLDISSIVLFGGERGLLGLAFHPAYASNGYFFVFYTSLSGDTVIARYTVSADPNVADPASAVTLMTVPQPFSNHKGGQLRFGPDGFLYIALGDGGSGGDPQNNGQNLATLLGKLLRIDVDSGSPYAVPASNPFVNTPGARGEIWALGLRNPWRFSFDRQTGEMFIADVGQAAWEEVNLQPATGGGRNYGWRVMEGRHCFNPSSGCNTTNLVLPIVEYSHSTGCSISGGFRYRGSALAGYQGTYFFGDLCTGVILGAAIVSGNTWRITRLIDAGLTVTTFGEDAAGELYVSHYADSGTLYRVVLASASSARLTVSANGPGTIASTPAVLECGDLCGADFSVGSVVTLHATASAGSAFLRWEGDADCLDGSVTLSSDRGCIARFRGPFTDPALGSGLTIVKAVHVTELRERIDAVRIARGLTAFGWTDVALTGITIRAAHVLELRSALAQAYTVAGRTPPAYTDPASLNGVFIKAVHITELRSAVIAMEQ